MSRQKLPASFSRPNRRGIAVLLILGMLAMTLALSYATLRGQATAAQQTDNLGRGDEARLAAEAGMSLALRKISGSSWAGVDTPLSGSVTSTATYNVTFATGDSRLSTSDPLYGEYPFRLTITSTGTATDPVRTNIQASYSIEAVVQLARRAIASEPSGWTALETYGVYQWANRDAYVQIPMHVEGPAYLKGKVRLCEDYPATSTTRQRYLQDQNAMRIAGQPDYRPFSGPLTLVDSRQDSAVLTSLQVDSGITTITSTSSSTSSPVSHPGTVGTYRLYPGGKAYTVPVLQTAYGSTLMNVTISPDVQTNPLGLFRSTGGLTICNNVNLTGTIISEGSSDVQICGLQVMLAAPKLPALEGSSQDWQLPVLILKNDLRLLNDITVGIQGQAIVFDEFEIQSGSQACTLNLNGQLFTSSFAVKGRTEWTTSSGTWTSRYNQFMSQLVFPPLATTTSYFPTWMQNKSGYTVQPAINIQRGSSGVKYHWQDWTQGVYQKDPSDSGLRWNLIRWLEDV